MIQWFHRINNSIHAFRRNYICSWVRAYIILKRTYGKVKCLLLFFVPLEYTLGWWQILIVFNLYNVNNINNHCLTTLACILGYTLPYIPIQSTIWKNINATHGCSLWSRGWTLLLQSLSWNEPRCLCNVLHLCCYNLDKKAYC